MKGKRRTMNGAMLGVPEAAVVIGGSERSLWGMIAQGVIPYRKLAGRVVFVKTELEQFLADLPGVSLQEARDNLKARQPRKIKKAAPES